MESVDAFLSLEPTRLFAAWIEGRSARVQLARLVDGGHITPELGAAAAAMSNQWYDYVGLGVVLDGADVAHVLFRRRADDAAAWSGTNAAFLAELPADEQQLMREMWGPWHAAPCTIPSPGRHN